jgi:hypothetical protein
MSKRKRINVSITPELYEELKPLMRKAGFTNLCQLTVASLNVMIKTYKHNKAKVKHEDIANDDDIENMFREYSNHDRQPDGTVPVRHPKRELR